MYTASQYRHAEQIQKKGLKGTVATFVTPSSSFSAHVSIPGDHMISNALAGVAVGYALGMKDEEIAETLFISSHTVKNHRKNVFRKLSIHSMAEFMRYANEKNLFKGE